MMNYTSFKTTLIASFLALFATLSSSQALAPVQTPIPTISPRILANLPCIRPEPNLPILTDYGPPIDLPTCTAVPAGSPPAVKTVLTILTRTYTPTSQAIPVISSKVEPKTGNGTRILRFPLALLVLCMLLSIGIASTFASTTSELIEIDTKTQTRIPPSTFQSTTTSVSQNGAQVVIDPLNTARPRGSCRETTVEGSNATGIGTPAKITLCSFPSPTMIQNPRPTVNPIPSQALRKMENPILFLAVCALGGVLLNFGFWAGCSMDVGEKFAESKDVVEGEIALEEVESEDENEFVHVSHPEGLEIMN